MMLEYFVKTPAPRRRFVDASVAEETWQIQHRIADKAYPKIRRLMLDAFGEVRGTLPRRDIIRLVSDGNEPGLVALVQKIWADIGESKIRQELNRIIGQTVGESAKALIQSTEEVLGIQNDITLSLSFDLENPLVFDFIDRFAADQVREVGDATREAIKDVIRRGFTEGRSIDQMARDIRQFTGLTTQQVRAIERFRQGLIESGDTPAHINRLVERKIERALEARAENIARTESITSSNAGSQALWEQAEEQGLWDVDKQRRFWIVTPDDRLCQICAPIPTMNPDGRALREPFQTPIGERLHPIVHPQCRCAVTVRTVTRK